MQRRQFLLGALGYTVLTPTLAAASGTQTPTPTPDTVVKKRVEAARWVTVSQGLVPGKLYRVHARGLTRKNGRDPLGPDGDPLQPGGRHHHVPGAPEGALVAKVGSFAFIVGERCTFQVPEPGNLDMVVNTDARNPGYRFGDLVVSVTLPSR